MKTTPPNRYFTQAELLEIVNAEQSGDSAIVLEKPPTCRYCGAFKHPVFYTMQLVNICPRCDVPAMSPTTQ